MQTIKTEYISYYNNGDWKGMTRGVSLVKGTISYWIVDKVIQWNISRVDKINNRLAKEAKDNFKKFKEAL